MVHDPKGALSLPSSLDVFPPSEDCIFFGGVGSRTLFGQAAAGKLVHISEAASGVSEGLICPDCAGLLIAKKGSVRIHHFAHASGADCIGAGETALHRLAKDLLMENPVIALPELKIKDKLCEPAVSAARLERIELETWEGRFRPDLKAEVPDDEGIAGHQTLYIEIRVTNAVVGVKLDHIRARGNSAIEVDLSRVDRAINREELALLIKTSAPRVWLFHHREAEHFIRIATEQKAKDDWGNSSLTTSEELTALVDKWRAEREGHYSSPPTNVFAKHDIEEMQAFTESDIEEMLERLHRIGHWSATLRRLLPNTVLGSADISDVALALSRILTVVDGLEPKRLASWLRNGLIRKLSEYTAFPVAKEKLDRLAFPAREFRQQVQRLADVESAGQFSIWGTALEDFAIRALSSTTPEGHSILQYLLGGNMEECRKYTGMIVTPRQKPKWIREDLPSDLPEQSEYELPYPSAREDDWR
jgi:hypothetical protein